MVGAREAQRNHPGLRGQVLREGECVPARKQHHSPLVQGSHLAHQRPLWQVGVRAPQSIGILCRLVRYYLAQGRGRCYRTPIRGNILGDIFNLCFVQKEKLCLKDKI